MYIVASKTESDGHGGIIITPETYTEISNLSFAPSADLVGASIPINEFEVDIHTTDTIDIGEYAELYDDNDVLVRITDDGLGMAPEQVAHLFEPYRTTKAHGTGLGLMITARIVRDHGGTIDVESAPGKGTAFTVRLPRLERRIRALK